jgi:hypothetical protein
MVKTMLNTFVCLVEATHSDDETPTESLLVNPLMFDT